MSIGKATYALLKVLFAPFFILPAFLQVCHSLLSLKRLRATYMLHCTTSLREIVRVWYAYREYHSMSWDICWDACPLEWSKQ